MAICQVCGQNEALPFSCRNCGGVFCSLHRLPENHNCDGLKNWNDPQILLPINHSFPSDSQGISKILNQVSDRFLTFFLPFFRGNLTYLFLALMWITLVLQWFVIIIFGMGVHNLIFTVSTYHPEYVWTWILSIFAHSPFSYGHIIVNSIALYFFGPSVERYLGTKKFFYLFIFSGILATLSQIGANLLTTTPGFVLGASGAIMAIMGFLTVLNPNLRVYLYFFLPLPLWVLTIGFAIISVFLISVGGFGAGGVAQLAHIIGLLIGIVYGERFKRNNSSNSATKTSFKPKIGF